MNKTIAIMQPYFLPYIGYWQLMNAVDEFIVYDNIQYTKKGWINRNRFLCGEQDKYFTIPLEKASDYLDIYERKITSSFDKNKLLNQISAAYRKAHYFEPTYRLFESIIMYQEDNLFLYIFHSINSVAEHLDINTKKTVSSNIDMDHSLKSADRVIEICKKSKATHYINPIGGVELYDKDEFMKQGLKLSFLKSDNIQYKQTGNIFIPFLSILDVLMHSGAEKTKEFLDCYSLE